MNSPAERVSQEFSELDTKLFALSSFLDSDKFKELSKNHQHLLQLQYDAMSEYGDILQERLNLFAQEEIQ